jgi:2,4'-dihydroxyacetophenone dioxygenase
VAQQDEDAMRGYMANESRIDATRDKYALPEGYIADQSSPWIPLYANAAIKYLSFDVRSNSVVDVFWVQSGGELGRHRHRGSVSGYTLEGSWRYLEYDWTARPGDFVVESPGRTHTMFSDSGMKALFWLHGPIEYLDPEGRITRVADVFSFIDHYTRHCESSGIAVNEKLFL